MQTKPVSGILYCLILFGLIKSGHPVETSVCQDSFRNFLQCMDKEAESSIDNFQNENSNVVQYRIKQCFAQSGCTGPDFSQAQMSFFIQEPWLSRINAIMDLLETVDPQVQRCMTDYYKSVIARKVTDCVKRRGPGDVRDFEMPPIPGGYNINISKMKAVFLQRMMVQYQMSQCPAATGGNPATLVQCFKAARHETDDSRMCRTRINCVQEDITNPVCQAKFNGIQQTICDCFNNEQGTKDIENTIQKTVMSGAMEKQLHVCYDQAGVPFPKAKMDASKKAIRQGFFEYLTHQGQLPPEVGNALKIMGEVVSQLEQQLKGAFCAECAGTSGQLSFQSRQNAGGVAFVTPPPLPAQQQQAPAQQSSQQNWNDFKRRLEETFGPAPSVG